MKLLVKGGHVVDPSTGLNQICDILIDNGRISAVGESLATPEEHCSTLDASGLVVAPGLVDLHVHLREPGQEDKETIATGCAAAARGGVTTLVSTSCTEAPGQVTCTVICGMSMSGIRDTGIYLNEIQPMTIKAMRHIVTAIGRLIRLRTIILLSFLRFGLCFLAARNHLRTVGQVQVA